MLAARKPEVDRARVIHTGWRRCSAAQEAEHMSAPNFDVTPERFFLRARRRPHMSSSLCLSLSAYADCPVELGGSSPHDPAAAASAPLANMPRSSAERESVTTSSPAANTTLCCPTMPPPRRTEKPISPSGRSPTMPSRLRRSTDESETPRPRAAASPTSEPVLGHVALVLDLELSLPGRGGGGAALFLSSPLNALAVARRGGG
ncbi:hypothetical protein SAMN05216328_12489 [Ensifer sp. YR511]|nr:hypothetical protein SAMN05216328_12489 [Ensifer sp. YR511]